MTRRFQAQSQCGRGAARRSRVAFTLLETMLAVAILALVGVAIYRFTASTLLIARIDSREALRKGGENGALIDG